MNLRQQNSELEWVWNGTKTKLANLDQRQLYSIKQTLNNNNNNWFGISKNDWLKAINPLLQQEEHMNIIQIVHHQEIKRFKSANGIADVVINMFNKN